MNFNNAIDSSKNAMAVRMVISCQTEVMPTPIIISFRMAEMYHRAGIISVIYCNMSGILSMGYIIPESNRLGRSSTIPDTSIAIS